MASAAESALHSTALDLRDSERQSEFHYQGKSRTGLETYPFSFSFTDILIIPILKDLIFMICVLLQKYESRLLPPRLGNCGCVHY
jgi:hypothetical protein